MNHTHHDTGGKSSELATHLAHQAITPLACAFVRWAIDRLHVHAPDVTLVLRGAAALTRLAPTGLARSGSVFLVDDDFLLAMAMATEESFIDHAELLFLEMETQAPRHVLHRLGAPLPARVVIEDLAIDLDSPVRDDTAAQMRRFIRSWRPKILEACREHKRQLFIRLHALGLRPGMKAAIVAGASDPLALEALTTLLAHSFDMRLICLRFNGDGAPSEHKSESFVRLERGPQAASGQVLWRRCESRLAAGLDEHAVDGARVIRLCPPPQPSPDNEVLAAAVREALVRGSAARDAIGADQALELLGRRDVADALNAPPNLLAVPALRGSVPP
jgi:hypothetical protein